MYTGLTAASACPSLPPCELCPDPPTTVDQVAVDAGHHDAAVFLMQRFGGWQELSLGQREQALPWLCGAGDITLVANFCNAQQWGSSSGVLARGLEAACAKDHVPVVRLLLDTYGVDAGVQVYGGRTALMAAASAGVLCGMGFGGRRWRWCNPPFVQTSACPNTATPCSLTFGLFWNNRCCGSNPIENVVL